MTLKLSTFAGMFILAAACSSHAGVPPAPASNASELVPASSKLGPAKSRCGEIFAIFDSNRDARVSLEELADRLRGPANADLAFRERDRDFDGYLGESEFCVRLGVTY